MASAFCVPFRKSLPISCHEDILLCFFLEFFPVMIMGAVKFYFLNFIFSFLFDVGVQLPQHHLLQDHLLPSSLLCPLLHKSMWVICGWVFCWILFSSSSLLVYPCASTTISIVTALEQVLIFSSVAPPNSVLFLQKYFSYY